MKDWKLPWSGQCRCGKVRIQVTAPPLLTMACHCAGCQTMSSSAFSLSIALPSDGLEVTKGETVLGGATPDSGHHFCPDCMTWMFTRPPQVDFLVNLRPSMLDDHRWFTPFVETFTSEGLPWARTPAKHSFERFPEFDQYETLTADFLAHSAETDKQTEGDTK